LLALSVRVVVAIGVVIDIVINVVIDVVIDVVVAFAMLAASKEPEHPSELKEPEEDRAARSKREGCVAPRDEKTKERHEPSSSGDCAVETFTKSKLTAA